MRIERLLGGLAVLALLGAMASPAAARDRRPPRITVTRGPAARWVSATEVVVRARASDGRGSGVARIERRVSRTGGRTWSRITRGARVPVRSEGTTLVKFRAVDRARNVSAWSAPVVVGIDRTEPTPPIITFSGGQLRRRWFVGDTFATISGGLDARRVRYEFQFGEAVKDSGPGGEWMDLPDGPFEIPDGFWGIVVVAIDEAGNRSPEAWTNVWVEREALRMELDLEPASTVMYGTQVRVSNDTIWPYKARPKRSRIEMSPDGETWTTLCESESPCAPTFSATTSVFIRGRLRDIAGMSSDKTVRLTVAPEGEYVPPPLPLDVPTDTIWPSHSPQVVPTRPYPIEEVGVVRTTLETSTDDGAHWQTVCDAAFCDDLHFAPAVTTLVRGRVWDGQGRMSEKVQTVRVSGWPGL